MCECLLRLKMIDNSFASKMPQTARSHLGEYLFRLRVYFAASKLIGAVMLWWLYTLVTADLSKNSSILLTVGKWVGLSVGTSVCLLLLG